MTLDEKYYKVCNTDRSDNTILRVMSDEDIEYDLDLINYHIKEIDRMLNEIEFYRVSNFYIQHRLGKNNRND